MQSSIKKISIIIVIICLNSVAGQTSLFANQLNTASYQQFKYADFLISNTMLSNLFANSTLWYFICFQNPIDINTKNDSSDIWTPTFLKTPDPYRYKPEHSKFKRRFKVNPDSYKVYTDIDSSGRELLIKETFYIKETGYPYKIELDDYLAIRQVQLENDMWDSLATNYDLNSALTGGDLSRMMAQSTGLTIPIPPNPLTNLFGKPEVNINVNGEVNLRVGWRFDSQNLGSTSAFGQTQSSPVFSQDIRVNVTGGIGDKFKIGTDWNTRRQFEYDNKFKISYEGEDDEIIKLIEVGNVSLPSQSSLIGGGQSLFGVRADFQFGPLYLKTIASQKRGDRKFVDVRGGASKSQFQIRAYDWAKNHFFLDTAYRSIYRDYFKYSTPVLPAGTYQIMTGDSLKIPVQAYLRVKEIEVWESTTEITNTAYGSQGVCFANLPPKKMRNAIPELYDPKMKQTPIKTGEVERATFMRLDSNRFRIDYNLGTLTIINLRQDRYYGVAYRIEGQTLTELDDYYYGTLSTLVGQKDTLILKLIYRPNLLPNYTTLWQRQMKNIYSINATQVSTTDTKIGMWYINQNNDSTDIIPGAPDKLVTVLNVDQVSNSTGTPPPDGQFDLRPPFFNAQFGEITFPSLEPFREGLRIYFSAKGTPQLAEQFIYPQIYDTTYDAARRATDRDRFVISGEVSGKQTDRISLGAYNLAPNSVRVTLDGVQLREFEDYIVDYYSGMLTLRNPRASLPNANLRVEYEQQDIFNISTRSLLGLRADYELIKSRRLNANLGFTGMLYDQAAIIDRVRLGDEPVSNTMFGFDAKLHWDAPWITKLLDALPFYDTKAPSSLNLTGEWAIMLPTPNKRKSEICYDNNLPVVYIDDFEGAQRYISLGLSPFQWLHCSQPVDSTIAPNDKEASLFRGKTYWWQYFLPKIPINDVYPFRQAVQGRSTLSPLYMYFNPYERGIYNKNPDFRDTLNPAYNRDSADIFFTKNNPKLWGGSQRLLSSFNTNFDNENIEYIEIMMHNDGWEPGKSRMFIDLGMISEDVIPNQRLDTEDGITPASPIPNGILDAGEDIGIDALNDKSEQDPANYPWPLYLEKDPARDDYKFDFSKDDNSRKPIDFIDYNNYEGNGTSELGQFPDTEILNRNNGQTPSFDNSYFSYEVNLLPDPILNTQIVGGNAKTEWFLWRIPIRKPTSKVGNPSFANIQYVRVWFKGGIVNLSIADWRLVGSQWQRITNMQSGLSPEDSTLQVAFVNLEENSDEPDFYTMPPCVSQPRQLNNPDPNLDIKLNEQSLSLSVKNLRYGDERMAVRYFRNYDIFNYKQLKFFIHGDGSMPLNVVAGAVPQAYAYIRLGIDSMNYYEYRRPLIRGWQNIEILLSQLTAIKQIRDSNVYRQVFMVPGDSLATFAIRGNPILTRVQFFAFGIANPAQRYPNELTTTMWIDELRLLDPESRSDWAGIGGVELKLADLAIINANISHTQPNFHKLEERFGNRVSSTNWNMSVQGNLEKFAPKSFKEMKVPITYTHSEIAMDPEYEANNDVNLGAAAEASRAKAILEGKTPQEAQAAYDATRTRSQTIKVQDSWALTGVRLGLPINTWLIKETFNKLTFGYSYSQEFERSYIFSEKFNWQWQMTSQYANNIPTIATVSPLSWSKDISILNTYSDWKFNFLPTSVNFGLNMLRSRTTEQSRYLAFPSPVFRNFTAVRQGQFSWKMSEGGFLNPIIDYNVITTSSLVPYELDENGRQRTGSELAAQMFFKDGKIIEFGQNNLHTQTVTINFKPRLPIGGFVKYFDNSGSFSTIYSWMNPLQPLEEIKDVAKSANFNNTIRYSLSIRLKALGDDIFGVVSPKQFLQKPPKDSLGTTKGSYSMAGALLKTIFFDWESVKFDFNQSNSSINPGVFGNTGIDNFWGRGIWGGSDVDGFGPGFPYQLGLVTDPHGGFRMVSSNSFPFFGFQTYTGKRPPNAVLQDNYSQKTTLDIRTSRPLWEGAILDLNWRTELGFNRNQTVLTDSFGTPTFTNIIALKSFNKTILTLPSIFGFNLFNNTIEHVIQLYNVKKQQIDNQYSKNDTVIKNQALLNALAQSFHDGMEAFSFFGGAIGKFLPAVNWALRWDGLEKWGVFENIGAKKISIEHKYQSRYTENTQSTDNGTTIDGQSIQHGFQPLLGVTMSFDEKKLKGVLTGTVRYATTNSYQITSANRATIVRQSTDELQIQASYVLRGFTFPLFNLTIQNDLEFSFLTSLKHNSRATYDVMDYTGEAGSQLDGSTQIKIEPRVRYMMSNRVKASFFVSYEGTFNSGASSPGYSTTQVGLDINISISGGR